jgi:hypothetical protein
MNVSDAIQQQANKLVRTIDYAELERVRQELGRLATMTRRLERALDEIAADGFAEARLAEAVSVPPRTVVQFPKRPKPALVVGEALR